MGEEWLGALLQKEIGLDTVAVIIANNTHRE
jgi:hypothetical protein